MTPETFYGGAVAFANASQIFSRYTKRVIRDESTAGAAITYTLPNATNVFKLRHQGGLHYIIVNVGARTITVRDSALNSVVVLSPGEVGFISLLSQADNTWSGFKKTHSAGRTMGTGTRDAIEAPATPETFDDFCFQGDECEQALSDGLVPLDGEEGRDLVVAPMFQNPVVAAINSQREAFRAADIVMPSHIPFRVDVDSLEVDPLHPLAGTTLSDAFYTALRNNNRFFILPYLGDDHGSSRHWHHIRWNGTDWEIPSGGVSVKRHLWVKDVTYEANGVEHNIYLVFSLEHTVNPEPTVVPGSGGGVNGADGMWGSGFRVGVFATELLPTWDEGDSFEPVGAAAPIVFTRSDPAAWGAEPTSGADPELKFCHPQLVLYGSVPTTFESPFSHDYIPWIDRKWGREFEGGFTLRLGNRESCYEISNGAPWLTGCTSTAPVQEMGCCVFGWTVTSTEGAAMTLGGDFPSSELFPFIVLENGLGTGLTYFRPTKPGWDEVCGVLDVAGGSSVSISFCNQDRYGVDGEGGRAWPKFELNTCAGHPDEPFEGVGGSHRCFNNNGAPELGQTCCITVGPVSSKLVQYCTNNAITYGDRSGSSCVTLSSNCINVGQMVTQAILEIEDYSYNANGDQDLRAISWLRYFPDPTQVFENYTYDSGDVSDITAEVGGFSYGATISVSSIAGSGTIRAMLRYSVSGHEYIDLTQTGRFLMAKTRTSFVGVGDYDTDFTGCIAVITPTGGNNATVTLEYWLNGTPTVLETVNITDLTGETVSWSFEKWGEDVTFEWTIGSSTNSITAKHCDLTNDMYPVLGTKATSTGAEFDQWRILDNNKEFVEVAGAMGQEDISVGWDPKASSHYGQCATVTNPDCGNCCSPPKCNCTTTTETLTSTYSASHSGGDILVSDNPTWCGGEFPALDVCESDKYCSGTLDDKCQTCPPYHPAVSMCIPTRCLADDTESTEPKMCRGITFWSYSEEFCA